MVAQKWHNKLRRKKKLNVKVQQTAAKISHGKMCRNQKRGSAE